MTVEQKGGQRAVPLVSTTAEQMGEYSAVTWAATMAAKLAALWAWQTVRSMVGRTASKTVLRSVGCSAVWRDEKTAAWTACCLAALKVFRWVDGKGVHWVASLELLKGV